MSGAWVVGGSCCALLTSHKKGLEVPGVQKGATNDHFGQVACLEGAWWVRNTFPKVVSRTLAS